MGDVSSNAAHTLCLLSEGTIHDAARTLTVFRAVVHADILRLFADVQFYLHNDSRFEVTGVLTGRHHLSLCIINAVQVYRGLW